MNTQNPVPASSRRISTKDMVLCGMFAAVLTVISQISVPVPPVPITIQVFGVTLVGIVLGWKRGIMAVLVYILLGAVGLPIFSNFMGGMGVLTGMTGGYIIGWPFIALLCGIRHTHNNRYVNLILTILCSLLGLAIMETLGGLQWAALSGDMTIKAIFVYSMTMFVPKDILLTILAIFIGNGIRRLLSRASIL